MGSGIFRLAALVALVLSASPAPAAEPPIHPTPVEPPIHSTPAEPAVDVLASIAPVHSLAAAVMDGAGEPKLLVAAGASPHTLALKPSEAKALHQASLVFWIGPGLEGFLRRPLARPRPDVRVVALSAAPGLRLLPLRGGEAWQDEDDDDHGHKAQSGPVMDMHLWLDPANARVLVRTIAAALAERDPARAALYRANAARSEAALEALERELETALRPVAGRPYLVFHDGYQYFERRFGLTAVGTLTAGSDRPLGAKRMATLRARARAKGARCVFAEPQFSAQTVAAVAQAIGAKAGVLDPLGQGLEPGPGLYPALMRRLAENLVSCLSP